MTWLICAGLMFSASCAAYLSAALSETVGWFAAKGTTTNGRVARVSAMALSIISHVLIGVAAVTIVRIL